MPVKIEPASWTNLSVFATLNEDRTLSLTVINKSFGDNARAANISLSIKGYQAGKMIMLSAPDGDIAAQSGVSLGGSGIDIVGNWSGKWKPLAPFDEGKFQCVVPATSAVVIVLNPA